MQIPPSIVGGGVIFRSDIIPRQMGDIETCGKLTRFLFKVQFRGVKILHNTDSRFLLRSTVVEIGGGSEEKIKKSVLTFRKLCGRVYIDTN